MKTNIDLVKHCETALKERWYYLWGSFAQKATEAVLQNNIKQYPSNKKWASYARGAIGKTRFCDCYGLVKSFLWWTDSNSNPKYNPAQDLNTAGAYNKAAEKGTLATLPEIPGIILYMQGHVSVYIGKGRFIECAGGGLGMVEGMITGGKVTKGSKFTHWFKDSNITYTTNNTNTTNTTNTAKTLGQKLKDKGLTSSPEHWDGVLAGTITMNREYLRALLERVV